MSRYTLVPHDPRYEVIVGWDPPMQTLFGQVFVTTVEDDDAACVLWVGLEVQALTIVAALQTACRLMRPCPRPWRPSSSTTRSTPRRPAPCRRACSSGSRPPAPSTAELSP